MDVTCIECEEEIQRSIRLEVSAQRDRESAAESADQKTPPIRKRRIIIKVKGTAAEWLPPFVKVFYPVVDIDDSE